MARRVPPALAHLARRASLLAVGALSALGALGGCSAMSGIGLGSRDGLSFAQVQSIHPGLSAPQVRDAFGAPLGESRGPDGRVARMEYVAFDAKQSRARLVLDFDAREILVTKTYTGDVVRP